MKVKNMCIYILFTIIIFSVFKVPEILLAAEENNIEKTTYANQVKQKKIDVETEKIYLVKAIHIMDRNKTIKISSEVTQYVNLSELNNKNKTSDIIEPINKMIDYNILNNIRFVENENQSIGILSKMYRNEENTYIINNIQLKRKNEEYKVEIEDKTGKIIYILFNKDKLYEGISKKEILENYIKYLDLYIIDDWRYEEDLENKLYAFKSEKTDLRAGLTDAGDDKYIISIHTNSLFY